MTMGATVRAGLPIIAQAKGGGWDRWHLRPKAVSRKFLVRAALKPVR